MVRHLLLHDRLRLNKEGNANRIAHRQFQSSRAEPGGDLTMEQAVAAKVDWDIVADMAMRIATKNQTKQILTAAAWGVVPTSPWLARHGSELETVCEGCWGTNDLRHAIVGCCEGEEIKE